MKTFKINGHVVDSQSHHGIKGLRVEAWDKNYIFGNKLLGDAITGGGGNFHIQFDESQFKHVFDQRPDLFVKVFREDELIKSTEDKVLWNVEREDIQMNIEVEGAVNNSTPDTPEINHQVAMRSILQATYTPRKPTPGESPSIAPRALEKGAFIARLLFSQDELHQLVYSYKSRLRAVDASTPTANAQALKVVETISTALSPMGQFDVLRSAKPLASFQADTLVDVAEDLIALRQTTLDQVLVAHETILEVYKQNDSGVSEVGVKPLMEWAIEKDIETQNAIATLALGQVLSLKLGEIQPAQFGRLVTRQLARLRNRVQAFRQTMNTEPVGYLHLEKMSFTPAGIERGELVYSVPLSPGEEVNIKHREWSQTSEEFERIVTDYMEEFSEEGVTEKSELSQAVNSQTQHSSAFNTAVSTSGEAFGFSISASVGYNASESASKSESLTRNHTRELTSKASSRSKREHKFSFRVASVVETEDQTVQRIINPFSDRATRVDYYQLIRKWKVDLYRYGIRLTYDIVIPEPGSGLLSKIMEIEVIRNELEKEFIFPLALEPTPEGYPILDDQNYDTEAAKYGASVKQPPLAHDEKVVYDTHDWATEPGGWDKARYYSVEVTVPQDYVVDGIIPSVIDDGQASSSEIFYCIRLRAGKEELYWHKIVFANGQEETKNEPYSELNPYTNWNGRSGELQFVIYECNVTTQHIELRVVIKRRLEIYEQWRLEAFKTIRDAAKALYYEERQKLKERLTRLEEELGAQDALSLRKKEREEIMKGVLDALGVNPKECFEAHEVIKFVQHAVEWENMLYFLYPYFWSDPEKSESKRGQRREAQSEYWEFKKYLDHPDTMHRAFLKAGAARVVLTIRSGFEEAVLEFFNDPQKFIDNPQNLELLPPSPYFPIAKEFEAYAQTNYPGIPPANPVENYRLLLSSKQKRTWEKMQTIMQYLEGYRLWWYPKQYQTWEDMKQLMKLLNWYYQGHEPHQYPSNLADLDSYIKEKFPDEEVPLKDHWDNDYIYPYYIYPSYSSSAQPEHTVDLKEYTLASLGADKQLGGTGEDADLLSSIVPKPQRDYPDTLDKLAQHFADEPFFQDHPEDWYKKDVWDNDFYYSYPGNYGEYDLVSYGEDGEPGGEGEDADITSWAGASLIGTWYEYTPTSALDIEFDQEIPSQ